MNRSQFVFGLLFVAVGGLLLADEAGQINAWSTIADWWPTIVIASGLAQLVTKPRNTAGGFLLIFIGAALLAWTLGGWTTIRLLWPALLILIGLWLLSRQTLRSGDPNARIDVTAALDDRTVVSPAGSFAGGSLTTIFGDLRLDLLGASLDQGEVTLHTTALFGDIHLEVPDRWRVQVSGPELLGDVILERSAQPPPDAAVLRLAVFTLFGDVVVHARSGPLGEEPSPFGRPSTP